MKQLGLLGGMSWESTARYYSLLNRGVGERLGGLRSARLVIASLDFEEVERAHERSGMPGLIEHLGGATRKLADAGAEGIVITSNTMHKIYPELCGLVSIPILHIADPTGEALQAGGVTKVGLLGTRHTMEQKFYRDRLDERFGLEVLTPDKPDRDAVHRIIYEELCRGVVSDVSRAKFLQVIGKLSERGAEAVILGCTEIGLLVESRHTDVQLCDTTVLHAEAALDWMLEAKLVSVKS